MEKEENEEAEEEEEEDEEQVKVKRTHRLHSSATEAKSPNLYFYNNCSRMKALFN